MGRGQVVRRLILAQEIVGSNPTAPAIDLYEFYIIIDAASPKCSLMEGSEVLVTILGHWGSPESGDVKISLQDMTIREAKPIPLSMQYSGFAVEVEELELRPRCTSLFRAQT